MSALGKLLARSAARRAVESPATSAGTPAPAQQQVKQLQARRERVKKVNPAEIDRICSLPIMEPLTDEEHEAYCHGNMLAEAYVTGHRLFTTQSDAFLAYEEHAGLFGPIGVGWGKAMISIGIADRGFRKGLRKILLCVPSQVYAQLMTQDIQFARKMIPIAVPFHGLGGLPAHRRKGLAKSNKVGCYILPYSLLSTRDTSELLEGIKPQLIVLDEAHNLKNRTAARTKRMLEVINKYHPEVVALSGTITNKSVMDYWHLIKPALKENNPLPMTGQMASDWGAVIDSQAAPSGAQTGPIMPLVHWAMAEFPGEDIPPGVSGFRKAYRLRLTTAPGVVSTGDQEISTSLVLAQWPEVVPYQQCEGGVLLEQHLDRLDELWQSPDGDEIDHAIHLYKWKYELHSGFYNSLKWPTEEMVAKRGCTLVAAKKLLEDAHDLHDHKQIYHRDLRKWLEANSRQGLDTPMLLGGSMAQHGVKEVGPDLYNSWAAMKSHEREGLPERYGEPVRVCPFKIDAAVKWAQEVPGERGGIIWVHHQEMGRWCYEALVAAGVDALHCPAGGKHNSTIADKANGNKVVVASITAHGVGKNLQHFQHQMFLQWPRDAKAAEQTLGRLHRNGQMADELVTHLLQVTEFDEMLFASTLTDSCYIHTTVGTRQKLMYAGYNPLPRVFNPAVLRQLGFENRMLTKDQRELMQDKFGEAEE